MTDVVFQVNIKGHRAKPQFDFSTMSWSKWCKSQEIEHFVLTEPIYDLEYMNANWHKFFVLELLEEQGVDYNQVCIVDADTIVHPNCPNFFELTDNKYAGVHQEGSMDWCGRSLEHFSRFVFDGFMIQYHLYINTGFQIFNKSHKDYLKGLVEWFHKNKDRLNQVFGKWNSTDQTCINFYREEKELPMTILPGCYNLQDMSRKNLMYYHPQQWWTDELHFLKNGWIYHFNAIPPNPMNRDANYWIDRTYKELYNV